MGWAGLENIQNAKRFWTENLLTNDQFEGAKVKLKRVLESECGCY